MNCMLDIQGSACLCHWRGGRKKTLYTCWSALLVAVLLKMLRVFAVAFLAVLAQG